MKQFFFSLRASYLFFTLLALVFGAGSFLAGRDGYDRIFKEMTATHLFHCLDAIINTPVVAAWLLVFGLVSAGIFINTFCCTLTQIKSWVKSRGNSRTKSRVKAKGKPSGRALMAWIHIAALLVIILHALDITLVRRHAPIRLYPGQTTTMGSYEITLEKISFVTDPAYITPKANGAAPKTTAIPREKFSVKENFATLGITRNGEHLGTHELRMLSPVRTGTTFFFLDGFFATRDNQKIGVRIHHSTNPLAIIFFAGYTILLILLVCRFFTVRSREENSP